MEGFADKETDVGSLEAAKARLAEVEAARAELVERIARMEHEHAQTHVRRWDAGAASAGFHRKDTGTDIAIYERRCSPNGWGVRVVFLPTNDGKEWCYRIESIYPPKDRTLLETACVYLGRCSDDSSTEPLWRGVLEGACALMRSQLEQAQDRVITAKRAYNDMCRWEYQPPGTVEGDE